jgi:hypothetical protein
MADTMSESLANWLALREPADTAARSAAPETLAALTAAVDKAHGDGPLQVLDLAAGTGSNLRYLARRLPFAQRWLLVDHDPRLLAEVPSRLSSWGRALGYTVSVEGSRTIIRGDDLQCDVETRCLDLGAPDGLDVFAGRELVTASALLDLVSARWLRAVAGQCLANRAAAFFALSYDGVSRCTPVDPADETVLALFNQHQARDKGLGGPAAGPGAVDAAVAAFEAVGYRLRRQQSDWTLSPAQHELQHQLIQGWADAAMETAPGASEMIQAWLAVRLAHLAAGRSHVTVCHEDLAAWP